MASEGNGAVSRTAIRTPLATALYVLNPWSFCPGFYRGAADDRPGGRVCGWQRLCGFCTAYDKVGLP